MSHWAVHRLPVAAFSKPFPGIYVLLMLNFVQTNVFAATSLPPTHTSPAINQPRRTFQGINMQQAVHLAVGARIEQRQEVGLRVRVGGNTWARRHTICLGGHTCPSYRANLWPLLTLWPRALRGHLHFDIDGWTHKHSGAFVHREMSGTYLSKTQRFCSCPKNKICVSGKMVKA